MRTTLWRASAFSLVAIGGASLAHHQLRPLSVYAAAAPARAPYTTWSDYSGGMDSAQYSALKQINKKNVTQLQQVWFYPAGNNGSRFGFNPVIVDNMMYVVGKDNNIVALDATTGKEIWVHDNHHPRNITHRGINYWESKDDRTGGFSIPRIIFCTRSTL